MGALDKTWVNYARLRGGVNGGARSQRLLHPRHTSLLAPRPCAELKLTSYTFESCVAAVLQLRTPHVPQAQLNAWFAGGPGQGQRWRW